MDYFCCYNKTSQHNMCFTVEKMLLENEMAEYVGDMSTKVWLQIKKVKNNYCHSKVNCVYIY